MRNFLMIHRGLSIVITEDGEALFITNGFDRDGDECDLYNAVTCVAGPDKNGKWISVDLREFEEVVIQ